MNYMNNVYRSCIDLTFSCGLERTTDRQHNTTIVTMIYLAADMITVSSEIQTKQFT